MGQGHALYQPLEQYGAVAGQQGVVAVDQVDLELAGGTFLQGGVERQTLSPGGVLYLLQEVGVLVEFIDRVELALTGALPGRR
jgi:hypothetical protein